MDTNTNTNTNTSGMSEIGELTDGELDAVNGGAVDAFIWFDRVNGSQIQRGAFSFGASNPA